MSRLPSGVEIVRRIENPFVFYREHQHLLVAPANYALLEDPACEPVRGRGGRRFKYAGDRIVTMSEYTPYYPENYFSWWELIDPILTRCDRRRYEVAVVGTDLAPLEAVDNYLGSETGVGSWGMVSITGPRRVANEFMTGFDYTEHRFPELDRANLIEYYQTTPIEVDLLLGDSVGLELWEQLLTDSGRAVFEIPDEVDRDWLTERIRHAGQIEFFQPKAQHPLKPISYLSIRGRHRPGQNYRAEVDLWLNGRVESRERVYLTIAHKLIAHTGGREVDDPERWRSLSSSELLLGQAITWCQQYHIRLRTILCRPLPLPLVKPQFHRFELDGEPILSEAISTERVIGRTIRKLRARMNRFQRIIDSEDRDHWFRMVEQTRMFRHLPTRLRWKRRSEVVTENWLAGWEILSRIEKLLPEKKHLRTWHLHEDGGMLAALNHHLQTKPSIDWQRWEWSAHSTTPQKHLRGELRQLVVQTQRWDHRADRPGTAQNHQLADQFDVEKYDLITATGRSSTQPTRVKHQEEDHRQLLLSESVAVLRLLAEGGSAVIRMSLPLAESFTLSLLKLLGSSFDSCSLVKPSSSDRLERTVYWIGRGYRGWERVPTDQRVELLTRVDQTEVEKPLFDEDLLGIDFLDKLETAVSTMVEEFTTEAKRSFDLHGRYHWDYELQSQISDERDQAVERWEEEFPVDRLRQPLVDPTRVEKHR